MRLSFYDCKIYIKERLIKMSKKKRLPKDLESYLILLLGKENKTDAMGLFNKEGFVEFHSSKKSRKLKTWALATENFDGGIEGAAILLAKEGYIDKITNAFGIYNGAKYLLYTNLNQMVPMESFKAMVQDVIKNDGMCFAYHNWVRELRKNGLSSIL